MLVWTLQTWKRRVLLEPPAKGGTKGLQRPLMAVGAVRACVHQTDILHRV